MKITVELSDSDIKEICRVTGERRKGPAIRKLVTDALLLTRREKLAQKFIDAEWGVELKGFEAAEATDPDARQPPLDPSGPNGRNKSAQGRAQRRPGQVRRAATQPCKGETSRPQGFALTGLSEGMPR